MDAIIEIVILAVLAIMGLFFKHYVSEKLKNIATSQDISTITTKVESIKADYLNQTYAWTRFFDFEFEHVKAVWDASYDLQISARSLSPIVDRLPLDEESRKALLQQRYLEYFECISQYQKKVLKNRPFIPTDLFIASQTVFNLVIPLGDDFEFSQSRSREPDWIKINDINQKLDKQIDEFGDQIRDYIYNKVGCISTDQ